ncbi:hypothetical protein E0W68_07700 [Flavobacterium salilacus subsp. salilacus]|uniref:HD domain-containing protein n=1 Tax=Flavobacterium TaxID=237 RepID=UPI0010756CAF|nr:MULTISPECIES: hypothetical protein [Flavobacterium]KAF2518632.1 hypothetical protein E0W68_07700 [Flavobacterium salilacus subsp. salilacus]MBE1613592.1 hypothetical protein [Flavobacterium sp. SaA2.13]
MKDIFYELFGSYTDNPSLTKELWIEIETNYSARGRHYHTIQHLENMYNELNECHDEIADRDTILFSLFYHDIIYDTSKKDNEEKSADVAVNRLNQIEYPENKIALCRKQILATKSHTLSNNNDTNLFTDADLSILGSSWQNYEQYYKQIRKEYSIYPDFLYKPGRKKVLQHFLDMESIFKTELFRNKYENTARHNLYKELQLL